MQRSSFILAFILSQVVTGQDILVMQHSAHIGTLDEITDSTVVFTPIENESPQHVSRSLVVKLITADRQVLLLPNRSVENDSIYISEEEFQDILKEHSLEMLNAPVSALYGTGLGPVARAELEAAFDLKKEGRIGGIAIGAVSALFPPPGTLVGLAGSLVYGTVRNVEIPEYRLTKLREENSSELFIEQYTTAYRTETRSILIRNSVTGGCAGMAAIYGAAMLFMSAVYNF